MPESAIRNPQSAIEKAAAFAALRERALACVKCPHLASSRKNVVFGVGNIDAQLMFVGEAPGADEDEQGEPFVGKAGQLLTKIIQATGLSRADVYIANILKCRPDTPGQSAGNRKPTPEEMATCIPYLHEQIDLIQPKVIVALGATAVEGLLGKTVGITKLRGNWQTYRGMPLMPTYHPAYLLRNQAMSEKRKVWEDMLAVMEKLEMPISEKQRNFFLKAYDSSGFRQRALRTGLIRRSAETPLKSKYENRWKILIVVALSSPWRFSFRSSAIINCGLPSSLILPNSKPKASRWIWRR